ncbi:class E sortase [Streptomyces sp. NPDC127178]|uniref:class E sortase n=1 Tax=unclassified Streptomyces TaxID=2593676 RepID=UPI003628CDF9
MTVRRRLSSRALRAGHRRTGAGQFIGIIGEALVTAAALLALVLVYGIWWTNVEADRQARSTASAIRKQWSSPPSTPSRAPAPGIGFLHIPALGEDAREIAIVQGTDPERLDEGVAGYYTHPLRSAMPWDREGNFSLAAHRDGHGAKFHNLDKVDIGDALVVETRDQWYIYTVFSTLPHTSADNIGVIEAVPRGSGRHTRGRYITLTTCTPVLTSDYRLIVWGELKRVQAMDVHRTAPAELDAVS